MSFSPFGSESLLLPERKHIDDEDFDSAPDEDYSAPTSPSVVKISLWEKVNEEDEKPELRVSFNPEQVKSEVLEHPLWGEDHYEDKAFQIRFKITEAKKVTSSKRGGCWFVVILTSSLDPGKNSPILSHAQDFHEEWASQMCFEANHTFDSSPTTTSAFSLAGLSLTIQMWVMKKVPMLLNEVSTLLEGIFHTKGQFFTHRFSPQRNSISRGYALQRYDGHATTFDTADQAPPIPQISKFCLFPHRQHEVDS
jgi:hypothetical protein